MTYASFAQWSSRARRRSLSKRRTVLRRSVEVLQFSDEDAEDFLTQTVELTTFCDWFGRKFKKFERVSDDFSTELFVKTWKHLSS